MSEPITEIIWLAGNCPVQAEGTINGQMFYFRARGAHWSLGIGSEPVGSPTWFYHEPYGDNPFAAGWMDDEEARAFIVKAARLYVGEMEIGERVAWSQPKYPSMTDRNTK